MAEKQNRLAIGAVAVVLALVFLYVAPALNIETMGLSAQTLIFFIVIGIAVFIALKFLAAARTGMDIGTLVLLAAVAAGIFFLYKFFPGVIPDWAKPVIGSILGGP